jgi:large subunit ribosomal protein L4
MVRLALVGALSDRASESRLLVIDEWGWSTPKTKDALAALAALGVRAKGEREARLLLVLDRADEVAWKSFRNLGERVQIVLPEELNTYDVLVSDWVLFTRSTLETTVARLGPADGSAVAEAVADEPAPASDSSDDAAEEGDE